MANNYLHFSFMVGFPNTELRDKAFAYRQSKEFEKLCATLAGEEYDPESDYPVDFDCVKDGSTDLWCNSGDEYGNVEAAAEWLSWVSRNCLNHATLGFQWAATCSKLRIGEFGGGAFWTNGHADHWAHTFQILTDARVENTA